MTERDDIHSGGRPAGNGGSLDRGRPFDDDRLLHLVLGLGTDPELEAAAQRDPELRRRLSAMREEMTGVAAGLERVVPPPPDHYSDLDDPRWGELRELVAQAPRVAARRRPRWLRVLAPAVAIALVLVAGIVGVQQLGVERTADEALTTGVAEKANEGEQGSFGAAESAGGPVVDGVAPSRERTLPDPKGFQTIVVARALTPASGRQEFAVERVLKGSAPETITLSVVLQPALPDLLHLLFLLPVEGAGDDAPSPLAGAGKDATGLLHFTYRGAPALAEPLSKDIDPTDVTVE